MCFTVQTPNGDMTIAGDTLIEAIGNNLFEIAQKLGLGNPAGVSYDSVVLTFDPNFGRAELAITAHGSDGLVNYDPYTDKPKTNTATIPNVHQRDVPDLVYTFKFKGTTSEDDKVDVFEDTDDVRKKIGYYFGLANDIVGNHARTPYKDFMGLGIVNNIKTRYPTMMNAHPYMFVEMVQQAIRRSFPKTDAKTQKMVNRADALAIDLMAIPEEELRKQFDSCEFLSYQVATELFFDRENKITALAYYRNKAGLTGKQLADMVGVSDRQIRNYESIMKSSLGTAKNTVIENLAKVLNVRPKDLVDSGIAVLVDKNK